MFSVTEGCGFITEAFGFKNKSSGYRLYKILVTNTLLPNGELTAIKIQ